MTMTPERKRAAAQRTLEAYKNLGADISDVTTILMLALFDHMDSCRPHFGPQDDFIDAAIYGLMLRRTSTVGAAQQPDDFTPPVGGVH